VKAKVRHYRISPRKARLVADAIRGHSCEEALAMLRYMRHGATRVFTKLINSAVANAQREGETNVDSLLVNRVYVDEGVTLRRFRFKAMGRVAPIRKRTSHITVELGFR